MRVIETITTGSEEEHRAQLIAMIEKYALNKPGRYRLELYGPDEKPAPRHVDPCLDKREKDEPMFILLARDSCAPVAMRTWIAYRLEEMHRGTRPDTHEERNHLQEVLAKIEKFAEWRIANRPRPSSTAPR